MYNQSHVKATRNENATDFMKFHVM